MLNYGKYLNQLIKELENLNYSHLSEQIKQAKQALLQGQFSLSQELLTQILSNSEASDQEKL